MRTEAEIERAIIKHLNEKDDVIAFKYYYSTSNRQPVRNVAQLGVADIIVNYQVAEMCFVIYMEVKAGRGKQRASQYRFEEQIKGLSGLYYIVKSIDDAEQALMDARQVILNNLQIAKIPW